MGSCSLVHQQSSGGGSPLEQRPVAFLVAPTFARAETFTLYLFALGSLRYITKDCHLVTSNYLLMNFYLKAAMSHGQTIIPSVCRFIFALYQNIARLLAEINRKAV